MTKILVTGGAGYLGDVVVDYLLRRGCKVTVYDNLTYNGKYMRFHPNLRFVCADIRNINKLGYEINKHDSVVHLAAIVGDGACAVNPEQTVEVNEVAVRQIADACREFDKKMIFASTCSVYGANNNVLSEDSPVSPLSLYAGTKLAAEQYVRTVPNHYIFRLGTLFGLSTEHGRFRADLVVNILTYKAALGEKISVFGGSQWRPLLSVMDAGRILGLCATDEEIEQAPGTYILSYENYTIMDIAQIIIKTLGLSQSKMNYTDVKYEDQRSYRVSSIMYPLFNMNHSLEIGVLGMAKLIKEGRIANPWKDDYHNAKFIGGLNAIR